MKTLSLWQPWASAIVAGKKSIETRSWSTRHRGPLAIHAARKVVDLDQGPWHELGVEVDDYIATRYPHRDRGALHPLPVGAVVAVCELVDCVPILAGDDCERADLADLPYPRIETHPASGDYPDGWLELWHATLGNPIDPEDSSRSVPDQAPFGDFTPGRFAWLLADVVPLERPVPVRGHQGLWEWTP